MLEVAEKYGMGFKRARTTFRSYAHVVQNNLNPEKRIISNTAAELQQMTAKKLVIGMLITPGILSIENLPLNEKVDKLCELVEQMKFGKLDRNDVKLVCETSSTLETEHVLKAAHNIILECMFNHEREKGITASIL